VITAGQTAVGTATTLVGYVPPGVCTVILVGGFATVYYGVGGVGGTALTTSNGGVLPSAAIVAIPCYPGSKGGPLYALSSVGSSVTIGYTVSTGG
jgi:hypothetical protein